MTETTLPKKYVPADPVGAASNLSGLLKAFGDKIDALVPDDKRETFRERLIQLVMLAATKQPLLLQCTQESLIQSVLDAAQTGLDISVSRGEAALVPFRNNKNQGRYECQFIPMYRGLARLARNSGEIKRIEAEVVCENDSFHYQKGSVVSIIFQPELFEERGAPIGVYALAEYTSGGVQVVFLSKSDVEKVRAVSKMKDKGPWRDWESEMWKKTAFRNLSKWLTLDSDRFHHAIEVADREYDLEKPERQDEDVNTRLGLGDQKELGEALTDTDAPDWLSESPQEAPKLFEGEQDEQTASVPHEQS